MNQQNQNRVLNVQLNPATDLSAFWTTESMGVGVGCHCEAERIRVQAERMLQGTEKTLAKKNWNAEVYKQQMQEMVEMGFARKLTDEVKKRHGGPVHYIGHHAVIRSDKKSTPVRIVFNSSVVFKGQCLNDYWFNGPDLLQSLFGVVLLHFREQRIAICADISKMYH